MIAVTPKIPLDLDGYASTSAYTEFLDKKGKKVHGVVFGKPHQEIEFLNQVGQVVLVDTSSLKGLPKEIDPQKVTEVIDHREAPETTTFWEISERKESLILSF